MCLVLLNGIFSMSEMAIVSARQARLQQMAEEGKRGAKAALDLAQAPDRFLSTVQIFITAIAIIAGAVSGNTVGPELAKLLHPLPWLANYSETLVVIGTTYLTLVAGELVPKRLALNNAERIAAAVARPMLWLTVIAAPGVWLLNRSTDLVVRLLGIRPSDEPPVTEEELRLLLDQGTQAGVFEEAEQDMVEKVFRLNDMSVGALMTPRTEITWLDVNDSTEEIRGKIAQSMHSRFPVCDGDLDNLLGLVSTKYLLAHGLKPGILKQQDTLRAPLFVPESLHASQLLDLFKTSETHTAIVIDEYGGTQGVITLHDVLEALVGNILSARDFGVPGVTQREDGSWLLDGLLLTDEFKELFEIDELPGESRGKYQTLAGFVVARLDRIPKEGQTFTWQNLRFEVIDMDGLRVDKILVTPVENTGTPVENTGTPVKSTSTPVKQENSS